MYTLIETPGAEGAAARLCVLAILLSLAALLISDWLNAAVSGWEADMLELDFSQTLGSLELQVSQTLPAQGITAIFGLSGAGKTSLINAIGGLTQPDRVAALP